MNQEIRKRLEAEKSKVVLYPLSSQRGCSPDSKTSDLQSIKTKESHRKYFPQLWAPRKGTGTGPGLGMMKMQLSFGDRMLAALG